MDDLKSNSGNWLSFRSGAFIWSSKKKDTIALSSYEAEYVAEGATTKQVLWLKKLIANLCVEQVEVT